MKKITILLAVIGMISLNSCSVNEDKGPDRDTISKVWEYTNVNFLPNSYSVVLNFPQSIATSDMVLVYRLSGAFQGEDIWKLLPESYFFDDGTLDFRFVNDFTRFNAEVNLQGLNLEGLNANVRLNQVLRVVSIPGYFNNRMSSQVDFSNYKATLQAFNIDDSHVQRIDLKK
ncbi:hypothetical protein [Flavobacterium sp.]